MAHNPVKIRTRDSSSSWDSFTMPAGGSANEIRTRVDELRNTASQERKALSGTWIPQSPLKSKR